MDINERQSPQQRLFAIRDALVEKCPALLDLKRQVYALKKDVVNGTLKGQDVLGHVSVLGQVAFNMTQDLQNIMEVLAWVESSEKSTKLTAGCARESIQCAVAVSLGATTKDMKHSLIVDL